ncbi:MAG: hypothetical protein QW478_10610 [Candidatus Micrarchaeaceae archaeon]
MGNAEAFFTIIRVKPGLYSVEISSGRKDAPKDFIRLSDQEILLILQGEKGREILLSKLSDFAKNYYDTNLLLDEIKAELADLNIQFENTHSGELPETRDLQKDILLTVREEVKDETRNISIIGNACLSAFTENPINLAVVAPSSEGKTHLVVQTVKIFPQQYVWMYRKVSPKTFTRERGILAVRTIKNGEETFETEVEDELTGTGRVAVAKYIALLREKAEQKPRKEDDERKKAETQKAKDLLRDIEERLYTLIDFHNKILVFLDRPDPELWGELLSVLSHDKEYIITSFVEGEGKKYVRKVVFYGWPAVLFCTSKDEDFNWRDLETRFQVIEPVMSAKKYADAVNHSFNKEYSIATSDNKRQILTNKIERLIEWMIERRPRVIFPFPPEELPKAITSEGDVQRVESGDLMRKLPRLGRHVAMNALWNVSDRVILDNGKNVAVVVSYSDIASLAYLFDDLAFGASLSGMGVAIFEFLTKIIGPAFESSLSKEQDENASGLRQKVLRDQFETYVKEHRKTTHLGATAESFTRYMKELEKRGFIKRIEDESDKRGLIVIPTWNEIPRQRSLMEKLKKLITPMKMDDVTIHTYLEKLNFSVFWKGQKLITAADGNNETENFESLANENLWEKVRKLSGFDLNYPPSDVINLPSDSELLSSYKNYIGAPYTDSNEIFYYTGDKQRYTIVQGSVNDILGIYDIDLAPEDILALPRSICSQLQEQKLGKLLDGHRSAKLQGDGIA